MTCLMTLRSETSSQRARKVLFERGIAVSVLKLDGEYAKKGCTYGIKFDCRSKAVVESILSDNKIPYSDIRSL